jgi:hypothetical protein
MASFTDAIPQFNPYIQQLPVEAMVSVGMEKQRRYDEGIQRIQSQIDQVAGLDIARPQDKEYLQSKLNQLGTKLRTVAAGDFSNYQLVNSTAGMASSVAKDKTVVNAVGSTQRYRKGLQDMETAIKEGKSNAANEWLFKTEASQWFNNPEVGASFDSGFQQYTNFRKNAVEIIKPLTKSKTLSEDAFTLDENGNLVIADAITRTELSGIPPEQIQQALMAGLSPDDFRQMQIEGRYNYSNVSDEQFMSTINNNYRQNFDKFNDKKKFLEGSLNSTGDVAAKEAIKQQIADIDKYLNKMKSDYENVSGTFAAGDVESAKARLFTRNFIDQFSSAFSFTEVSKTYEESPFAEAARWRENLAWDKTKFARGEYWKQKEYDMSVMNYNLELMKFQQEGDKNNPIPRTVDAAIDQKELPDIDMSRLQSDIELRSQSLENSDKDFLKKLNGTDTVSDAQVDQLGQQYEEWLKRPNGVAPEVKEYFERTSQERESLKADNVTITQIEKQLIQEFPDLKMTFPSDIKNQTVKLNDGRSLTVTPANLAQFAIKYPKYKRFYTNKAGATHYIFDDALARKELNEVEYKMYETMKLRDRYASGGMTDDQKSLAETFTKVQEKVLGPYYEAFKKSKERAKELIKERYTTTAGISRGIPLAKPEQKDEFRSSLAGIISVAQRTGGELANSPGFKLDDLMKAMVSPNMTATITSTEKTQYQEPIHTVTVVGDGVSTSFRISESQKQSMFPGEYQADPRIQFATPLVDQARRMGGTSTSLNNGSYKSSHDTAFLKGMNFPQVTSYGITGDIASLEAGDPLSKKWTVKVNIYDPMQRKWIDDVNVVGGSVPAEKIYDVLSTLDDTQIFRLLNGRTPTKEELSKLKENSKIPF